MLKQTLKKSAIIAIVLVIMVSMATTVFAADIYKNGVAVNTSWKDIATSTTGFNKNIHIFYQGTVNVGLLGILKADIRMIDGNGNVVWSQNQVCASGGQDFRCGSDVYKVQIKVASGIASASAWPK